MRSVLTAFIYWDQEHVSITENKVCITVAVDLQTYEFINKCSQPQFSVCSSADLSELAKAAKKKLQSVSVFTVLHFKYSFLKFAEV